MRFATLSALVLALASGYTSAQDYAVGSIQEGPMTKSVGYLVSNLPELRQNCDIN
jgi:hypothetical protein